MKKKVFAFILARSGSKSIKDKNIQKVGKLTLIQWTIKTCLKSSNIDKIIFATDSIKYAKMAKKAGANYIVMRPREFSKDQTSDFKTINYIIKKIQNLNYDYIAHMRPTTPLRKTTDVDKALNFFLKSNYNSLRSVHEMPESAYKSFEISKNNNLKTLSNSKNSIESLNKPRQSFKKTYVGNGVIDIYKKNFVIKHKKLLSEKTYAFVTELTEEVDTIEQLNFLNYIMKNKKNDKNYPNKK
jgi:CMP-N-acetylneuraminic acid synthetase